VSPALPHRTATPADAEFVVTIRVSADDDAQSARMARRVVAALRSAVGSQSGTSPEFVPAPRTPNSSALRIDVPSRTVWLRGHEMDLTRLEFDLLLYMARHPGRVFRRTTLLTDVWQADDLSRTRTIDVHIRRLRSKLGPDQFVINTIRRVGYRLDVDADVAIVE
jgi:DNA-binding response OmpR family regulator